MHGKIWRTFGDEPETTANKVVRVKIPNLPALTEFNANRQTNQKQYSTRRVRLYGSRHKRV